MCTTYIRYILIVHRYAGRRLSNQELCDFAEEMRQELSKWQDNLRPELKVDLADEGTIYLPHVLQLQ